MTDMPKDFPIDSGAETGIESDSGQRINGVVDVPRPGRVAGWAIDRADPAAAVTVTVLREGRMVGQVRADAHRPDLERGGIGSGRYGFALDLEPPLEPGFEFTVTAVARADDGTTGEIRPVGRARATVDADRRLAERTFEELFQVRAALRGLAGRQDRAQDRAGDRPVELRALEALDRIEVVQARLEQALAGVERPERQRTGRGLGLVVALALATGMGSLALGIWSMLAA